VFHRAGLSAARQYGWPRPRIERGMNTRISFMHLELLLLGRGALQTSIFDPRLNGLLSNIVNHPLGMILCWVPQCDAIGIQNGKDRTARMNPHQ
jgi:hypothetical protein